MLSRDAGTYDVKGELRREGKDTFLGNSAIGVLANKTNRSMNDRLSEQKMEV